MIAAPAVLPDSYYAGLPPITPASFGRGSSVSRRRSRRWCTLRNFQTFAPVGFVLGLVLYPYVPFIYLLAYKTTYGVRDEPLLAAYQVVVYHFLLGLALWAYHVTLRTPAGSPLDDAADAEDNDDETGYALVRREEARTDAEARAATEASQSAGPGLMAKASTGGRRFCSKCNVPKPDRCHHCSSCGRCVLKMDHHCVWLSTCIGHANYRAFLLFLTYVSFYALFVGTEAGRTVYHLVVDEDQSLSENDFTPISHFLLVLDGFVFSLSLGPFAIYHWSNTTTLEAMSASRAPPALVLPDAVSAQAAPTRPRWRPDHLLTQRERREARWEPTINPWDVGWRANLLALSPKSAPDQRPGKLWALLRWLRPSAVGGSGTAFEPDPVKVARLRARTRRVRLGETTASSLAAEGAEAEEIDRWGVVVASDEQNANRSSDDDDDDEEHRLVGDGQRLPGSRAGSQGKSWDTRTWRAEEEDDDDGLR